MLAPVKKIDLDKIQFPVQFLRKFMKDKGEDFVVKHEQSGFNELNNKIERAVCFLKFNNGTELWVDVEKLCTRKTGLRSSILDFFLYADTFARAAPHYNNKTIFRWGHVSNWNEELVTYGSPCSLTWYCAHRLGRI